MARCKDCLHYEACYAFSKIINSAREVEKGCEYFKNRTKYVEVCRCKDCKHGCEDHEDAYLCNNAYYGLMGFTRGEDFCSYGERRTDGN